jgi:2-oxoisovalerate dehydrogenase E1 component
MTFRVRGHEEASGTKYYPEGIIDEWSKKDPVALYEEFLLSEKIITPGDVEGMNLKLKDKINTNLKAAYAEPDIEVNTEEELEDLFAPFANTEIKATSSKKKMRYIDAIQDGLRESMRKHDRLVLMGQDIAEYGGVFKVTEGFVEEFGKGRVRNTPLCESAIVGAGLGLSMKGHKAMVEMQFADFVTCGFNQIVNNLAKLHYRWAENADVVVRMPTGGGAAAGPFHSQSNEAWFFHTPGLKIAYPAFPSDAKGLLCQSFEDPNPVLFFEHKMLYRSIEEEVSEGYFALPFGKARIVSEGDRLTLVTYGLGVHWGLEVLKEEKYAGIELIDLRTLAPLDYETVMTSVKKTGKVVILHEDSLTGGIGGELAARITEECFEYLDAPVTRCASLDTPIPFNASLEINFMANNRLRTTLDKVLSY